MGATATREKAGAEAFGLGDRERVRVGLAEFQGRPMVNTQLQVFDEEADAWVPRRGLTLPPKIAAAVGLAMVARSRDAARGELICWAWSPAIGTEQVEDRGSCACRAGEGNPYCDHANPQDGAELCPRFERDRVETEGGDAGTE